MATKITLGFLSVFLFILPFGLPETRQTIPEQIKSSSVLTVTTDGTILLVVNPDSNTLTFLETTSKTVQEEIPVGLDPRSVAVSPDGNRALVANQGDDSVSVIDIDARTVVASIPVGDRPVSVVISPDGRFAAIAESGADQVRFLDTESLAFLSIVTVNDRPYGLSFTPDGQSLLVTHLLSGSVTLIPVRPYSCYIPLIMRAPSLTTVAHSVFSHQGQTSIINIPTWYNVAPAPSVIVNATGTRAYLLQTMAHNLGFNTGFDTSVFPKVSVLNLQTGSHQTTEHISLPETDRPVGLPWDAALTKNDTELWVANAGSNDVSVIDISTPKSPTRIANISVGDNPRGIIISPDGNLAYVSNSLAGTVTVIDTNVYTVTDVITVTNLPLPPALLLGKRLFHSSARPELSRANWISCNTCHVEGEHDGRTWLLQYMGDLSPGATPVITRNTTSLIGMIQTYPLRWSAEWNESADSEFSIRFEQFGDGLIPGDMHPTLSMPNQGRSYDLDCLALYIDSLALPDRYHELNAMELRGKAVFESPGTQCATCHPAPLYTDLRAHDVGTADSYGEWFGPLIDTPTLRFLYDSSPYLHDGSAESLHAVLTSANSGDKHGITSHLSAQELEDLMAFLSVLPANE